MVIPTPSSLSKRSRRTMTLFLLSRECVWAMLLFSRLNTLLFFDVLFLVLRLRLVPVVLGFCGPLGQCPHGTLSVL